MHVLSPPGPAALGRVWRAWGPVRHVLQGAARAPALVSSGGATSGVQGLEAQHAPQSLRGRWTQLSPDPAPGPLSAAWPGPAVCAPQLLAPAAPRPQSRCLEGAVTLQPHARVWLSGPHTRLPGAVPPWAPLPSALGLLSVLTNRKRVAVHERAHSGRARWDVRSGEGSSPCIAVIRRVSRS